MKNTILKKEQNPIVLEELKLSASEPNLLQTAIFYLLFLMLGVGSSLGCFYSSFAIPISLPVIVLFFIIFSCIFTGIYLMKRKNLWFVIGSAAFGALFYLIFQDSIYRGFLIEVKYILEAFRSKGSGVSFPKGWNDLIKGANYELDSTIFLLFLMYIFIFLEAWAIIKRRNFFLAAFVTLPFIIAPVLVPLTPSYFAIVFLFAFYGMSMFLSPTVGGNKVFKRGLKGYHISSPSAAQPIAFVALPILLSIMLVISLIFPQSAFHRSEFLDSVRLSLVNGFDSTEISRYLNSKFGGDTSSINFNDVGDISFKNKPVLRLTLTNGAELRKENIPHDEYIKSYVGSVYSKSGWELLSNNKSAEVKNIIGNNSTQQIFDNVNKIFGLSGNSTTFSVVAEWCNGGNPRLIYTPYNLIDIEPKDEISYIDDGYITAKNEQRGLDKYSYSAYSSTSFFNFSLDDLVQTMYTLNSYYSLDDYFNGVAVEGGTLKVDKETGEISFIDENGNVYSTNEKINLDEYYSRNRYIDSDADTRTLVSELYDSGNIDRNDFNYLNMLIDYDKFVNENYTQLPENTKSFLQKFIKDKNINTSSMDNTIIDVMSLLVGSNEYKYTLSPGKTPDGEDFVEYFLSKNKKGYCRHFASSAVLLLRAAGIPARYAEGFKFNTAKLTNIGSIEMLDSDAHAWVEVYYSGTGWKALDFTPSDSLSSESSIESSSYSSTESSESMVESSNKKHSEASPSDTSSEQTSTSTQSNTSSTPVIVYILFIPMCAAIVFATLWINRFIRVKKRKKIFSDKNKNKALLAIYSYIVQLLLYKVQTDENNSIYDNIKQLIEKGDTPQEKKKWYELFFKEIYPIAEKAKFSGKPISSEELSLFLKYSQEIHDTVMNSLNFFQRLVAKYMDIL